MQPQSDRFLRDLSTGKALLQRKVIWWSEITKGPDYPGSPPTRQPIRSLIVNTGPLSERRLDVFQRKEEDKD